MITAIKNDEYFELKKDYNKEKLCNYFCSLCGIKTIDFLDPYIFWDFVKHEQKYYNIEIKLKRDGKYFVKTSFLGRGEYFNELEYGILYMIAKTVKKMIDRVNFVKIHNPDAKVDYKTWEKYKQDLCEMAFNKWLDKKGL